MRHLIGLFLLCAVVVQAEETADFWKQLTPEERKAAGLEQLTPEQQAALDQAVARFAKDGARKAVETVQAQTKAETAAVIEKVKAEAKAEGKAEATAAARAEVQEKKMKDAGLEVRSYDEAIRTRIAGDFRGWEGRTRFTMENGQVWQQVDKEERFFPKQVNPEVEIAPSKMGGWKMSLVKEGLWIRVKRVQ